MKNDSAIVQTFVAARNPKKANDSEDPDGGTRR